ncbi:MAG: hypothetical protein ABIJ09_03860 [Pseudomonadota bacterium]
MMFTRILLACATLATLPATVQAVEVYPLDKVNRGLKGQGVTVIAGDALTRFGVTVLGVLPDFIGPGQDLILARLDGTEVEYTGVISGMSGSPVYVDGKLLGAVSYRLGMFSKEPIAGITPAALMLAAATPAAAPRARRTQVTDDVDLQQLRPIDTPLVVAGAPPGLIEFYAPRLREHGLIAVRGGAGARSAAPAKPFVPGGAMAGVLVDGDINLAATGTVTLVEGTRIIGFGHPFLGRGASAIPLATAEIVATLPSLAGSSKIGVVTGLVGTLVDDRSTAVVGEVGALPPMVSLQLDLDGDPHLLGHDQSRVFRFKVFQDPTLTPLFVELAMASALGGRVGFNAGGSAELRVSIQVPGRTELRIEERVSVSDGGSVAAVAARLVGSAVGTLWSNRFEPLPGLRVTVRARLAREPRQATLVSARISPPALRAGESAEIEVQLQDYHGQRRTLRQRVSVPEGEAPGTLRLLVGGDEAVRKLDQDAGRDRVPTTLDDILHSLAQRRQGDRLYLVLAREDAGLRVDGTALPGLPPSMLGVLSRGSEGVLRAATTQRIINEQSLDPGLVIQGQISLELELLPQRVSP